MTNDEFVSITRGLVKRGWNEIEPKVAYMFASGGIFGILVTILASYHVPITPEVREWGPYLVGVLGGYILPSSGQVIVTKPSENTSTQTVKTVGAVETIVTGAIPVQSPAEAPRRSSFTQTVDGTSDPDAPTQVIPSSSRVGAWAANLPADHPLATPATPAPAPTETDGH